MKRLFKQASTYLLLVVLIFSAPYLHKKYIIHQVGNRVVKLLGGRGMGTGFHVQAPSGKTYIVSNHHVCRLAQNDYMSAVSQDVVTPVKVLERSKKTDLCILEPSKLIKGLSLASNYYSNQEVAAIGHPSNMQLTFTRGGLIGSSKVTMMWGIIGLDLNAEDCEGPMFSQAPIESLLFQGSQKYQRDKYEFLPYYLFNKDNRLVQSKTKKASVCLVTLDTVTTNVQVLGGNSGSPVVDIFGNVAGVVFARYSEAAWGAIIPLSNLKKFIEKY